MITRCASWPTRCGRASAPATASSASAALPDPITISAGIAGFPAYAHTRDDLLAGADAALYSSKRSGKNRTTIAGTGIDEAIISSRREAGLELIHSRDPDTATHSMLVAILAVEMARELGLADARLDDLRTAARLHDIGKLGVPAAILDKAGPLDDDEFRIVKTHPLVGAELLRSWGLAKAATIVLQHHERLDGSGYPAGLRGDQICSEGRIVHAADAYVAMVRDRPYRKAIAREKAVAELERHAGTQFDASVVAALIAVERARPAEIADAADRGPSDTGDTSSLAA